MSEAQFAKQNALLKRLETLFLPDCTTISLAEVLDDITANNVGFTLHFKLGYPFKLGQASYNALLRSLLADEFGECEFHWTWGIPPSADIEEQKVVPGVKHIIAVASGKGGVGKSTCAVNLALALAREGARVGMLDADIYGPSQHHMLNVADQRPEMADAKTIKPIPTQGIHLVSMGNLVTKETPMVWRGPMATGALQQLLRSTAWENIEYLIVDMPPGTGDIQLTLAQTAPISGAVVITTPQDIALLDAIKGIEMFQKVEIPTLGVIENMATHICSECGHEEAIFGEGGGKRLAADYGVELLGRLPLSMDIRRGTDKGAPSVAQDTDSQVSVQYRDIARKLAAKVWLQTQNDEGGPVISVKD